MRAAVYQRYTDRPKKLLNPLTLEYFRLSVFDRYTYHCSNSIIVIFPGLLQLKPKLQHRKVQPSLPTYRDFKPTRTSIVAQPRALSLSARLTAELKAPGLSLFPKIKQRCAATSPSISTNAATSVVYTLFVAQYVRTAMLCAQNRSSALLAARKIAAIGTLMHFGRDIRKQSEGFDKLSEMGPKKRRLGLECMSATCFRNGRERMIFTTIARAFGRSGFPGAKTIVLATVYGVDHRRPRSVTYKFTRAVMRHSIGF